MFFWLFIYPSIIISSIQYAVSTYGFDGYNMLVWVAVPFHLLFSADRCPSRQYGEPWTTGDTASMGWYVAFAFATLINWGVIGDHLRHSVLGYLMGTALTLGTVFLLLYGFVWLIRGIWLGLNRYAPGSGATQLATKWAIALEEKMEANHIREMAKSRSDRAAYKRAMRDAKPGETISIR